MYLQEPASNYWMVYFVNDHGETPYGPYNEDELLSRLTLAPFFFEEMVFIYHLIESPDTDLRELGIRLLRKLIC